MSIPTFPVFAGHALNPARPGPVALKPAQNRPGQEDVLRPQPVIQWPVCNLRTRSYRLYSLRLYVTLCVHFATIFFIL